jgi:hypothetical protein
MNGRKLYKRLRRKTYHSIFGSRAFLRLTFKSDRFPAYPKAPDGFESVIASSMGKKNPDGSYDAYELEGYYASHVTMALPTCRYFDVDTNEEVPFDKVKVWQGDDNSPYDYSATKRYGALMVRHLQNAQYDPYFAAFVPKDHLPFSDPNALADIHTDPNALALLSYARECDAWRYRFDGHIASGTPHVYPERDYIDKDDFWPEFSDVLSDVTIAVKSHTVEYSEDGTITIDFRIKAYSDRLKYAVRRFNRLARFLKRHGVPYRVTVL